MSDVTYKITLLATEKSDAFVVGSEGVKKITEHGARGEGDRWFYDVWYDNGDFLRVFNPASVSFTPNNTTDDIPF